MVLVLAKLAYAYKRFVISVIYWGGVLTCNETKIDEMQRSEATCIRIRPDCMNVLHENQAKKNTYGLMRKDKQLLQNFIKN